MEKKIKCNVYFFSLTLSLYLFFYVRTSRSHLDIYSQENERSKSYCCISASGIISKIKIRKMDYNPILTSFLLWWLLVEVVVIVTCTLHCAYARTCTEKILQTDRYIDSQTYRYVYIGKTWSITISPSLSPPSRKNRSDLVYFVQSIVFSLQHIQIAVHQWHSE